MELDQWRFVVELSTLAIAVVGVGFGLWQLGQATKHRKLELGSLYIQRFWQIDDDLLRSAKGSSEHNQARHRYVRLCEDEFEAARRGWLELGQWRAWHEWLTDPRQQAIIGADLEVCDPGSERFEYLRGCLDSGPRHGWEQCRASR